MKCLVLVLAILGCVFYCHVEAIPGCCSTEQAKEVQHMWSSFWSNNLNSFTRYTVMKNYFQCMDRKSGSTGKMLHAMNIENMDSPAFHALATRVLERVDLAFHLLRNDAILEIALGNYAKDVFKIYSDEVFAAIPGCYEESFGPSMPCFNPRAFRSCFKKIHSIVMGFKDHAAEEDMEDDDHDHKSMEEKEHPENEAGLSDDFKQDVGGGL